MSVYEFKLPDVGEGLSEGEIVKWHAAVGDQVVMDQLLVEIAPDVRVRVMRGNVAEVIRRSEVDFDDEEDFEDDIDETDETDELEHDDGQDDEKNTDR